MRFFRLLMPRSFSSLSTDRVGAPPSTADADALTPTTPLPTTSLSTARAAAVGSALGCEERSSWRVGADASRNRTSVGRREHTHRYTVRASAQNKVLSIDGISTGRVIKQRGSRNLSLEASLMPPQIPVMQNAALLRYLHPSSPSSCGFKHRHRRHASLAPLLHSTSPPARTSTPAGVGGSHMIDAKCTGVSRTSDRADKAGALRTCQQMLRRPPSVPSAPKTSTPTPPRQQSVFDDMKPDSQPRLQRSLASLTCASLSPTRQDASAVEETNVRPHTASSSAVVTPTTICTETVAPVSEVRCRPLASFSNTPPEAAATAVTWREVVSQDACRESHSSSITRSSEAGRGARSSNSSLAASENPSGALMVPTSHRLNFVHERVLNQHNPAVETPASRTCLTRRRIKPPPANSSNSSSARDQHACSRARDEDKCLLNSSGGANGVQSSPSSLILTVPPALALQPHQRHPHSRQASSTRSEYSSEMSWGEDHGGSSRAERVLRPTNEETRQSWAPHHTPPRRPLLAPVAPAPPTAAANRMTLESIDEGVVAEERWVDHSIRTSPLASLHASEQHSESVMQRTFHPEARLTVGGGGTNPAGPASQVQAGAASVTRSGDHDPSLEASAKHAKQNLLAVKRFSSISQARDITSPSIGSTSSMQSGHVIGEHPSASSLIKDSGSSEISATAVKTKGGAPPNVASLSLKPGSEAEMPVTHAANCLSPLSSAPVSTPTMFLSGFASRSPTPVNNAWATTAPLQERSRLRTPPPRVTLMPAARTAALVKHRAGNTSRVSSGYRRLVDFGSSNVASASDAPTPAGTTTITNCLVTAPLTVVPSTLVSNSDGPYTRLQSSPHPLSPSYSCGNRDDGTNDDCLEEVANVIGQRQRSSPVLCVSAMARLTPDTDIHVGLCSITTGSDAVPRKMASPSPSVSPLPQRYQLLGSVDNELLSSTTMAARGLMTALSPAVRQRPDHRVTSNLSLTSGNCGDTTTSTSCVISVSMASAGVEPPLGTVSTGCRRGSISGKACRQSIPGTSLPQHHSVGSASSLSSLGAFVLNSANAALMMHNGALHVGTECAPLPTANHTFSDCVGQRTGRKAVSDTDDTVRNDEGGSYLEERASRTCKATKGEDSERWGILSSSAVDGARRSGKRLRLKPGTAIEVASQAGTHSSRAPRVTPVARSGCGDVNADIAGAGVTNHTAAALQTHDHDHDHWLGRQDPMTSLSCAASFTASSTSSSATYASSSFGTIVWDADMVLPYPHGAEHVKKEQSAPPPQGGGAGGDYSVCYSSAKEKSGKGNDVCVLYSTAPQQHHFYRTLSAAAEPRGVCQRRREKRHHRYVRVHHRRQRGRRTPSRSLSSGKNGVGREKQSRVAGPLWTSSKGVGTARGGLTTCSPHLSTSSLLYYDDVDSDAVDDIYYQIEKRLFPIAAKTELIRGTRSSRPATPSPRSHAAEAAASPPGDAEEDPHEGSKESPIDALFTVLSVPLHLHLRGGFHLSDYYAPCPVCHPALLANSENGAAPGVDGTVSGRCSCSSVCPRPRRHSDSASKEILVASGNVLSLPTSSVLFTGASTLGFATGLRPRTSSPSPCLGGEGKPPHRLSGAHSAKGTSSVSLLSAEHAANLCDARRREQKAADPATAVNRGTTTAGKLTCFTRTAPSRIPPAGAVRGHVSSPSAAEASVRKYREDDGGVGCPPSPFVLSAPTRQSRYRRQRRRHKPAGIVARRRGAHHLGSGTGDGALRSQCSSFMRQCLLCVHINGRLAYIDPKGATGAARLLAGAALLAQKTKRKEAAKKQRHRVAANINEPTRTPITPLASQPG